MSLSVNSDTQVENLLSSVRHMDKLLRDSVQNLVLCQCLKYAGEGTRNQPYGFGVAATISEEAVQISTLVSAWFVQVNERLISRWMVVNGRLRVLFD